MTFLRVAVDCLCSEFCICFIVAKRMWLKDKAARTDWAGKYQDESKQYTF